VVEGVRLRALVDSDCPRIVEACSDQRTRQWIANIPTPYSEPDAVSWLSFVRLVTRQARATRGPSLRATLTDCWGR